MQIAPTTQTTALTLMLWACAGSAEAAGIATRGVDDRRPLLTSEAARTSPDAPAALAAEPQAEPRRIVISLPARRLAVVEGDRVLRVFDVAVGASNSPSPVGIFTLVNRLEHPTYYGHGKVIGPGPANPLGTRWLGLDVAGYGIHGTDSPASIGYAKSHGCIRLHNADIEALFEMVRPGDRVHLVADQDPETDRLFAAEPATTSAIEYVNTTASREVRVRQR